MATCGFQCRKRDPFRNYLNQCWLIISKVQWHSSRSNFIKDTMASNRCNQLEIIYIKFNSNGQRDNELKHTLRESAPRPIESRRGFGSHMRTTFDCNLVLKWFFLLYYTISRELWTRNCIGLLWLHTVRIYPHSSRILQSYHYHTSLNVSEAKNVGKRIIIIHQELPMQPQEQTWLKKTKTYQSCVYFYRTCYNSI